jgi:hypothetical protein
MKCKCHLFIKRKICPIDTDRTRQIFTYFRIVVIRDTYPFRKKYSFNDRCLLALEKQKVLTPLTISRLGYWRITG